MSTMGLNMYFLGVQTLASPKSKFTLYYLEDTVGIIYTQSYFPQQIAYAHEFLVKLVLRN